MVNIYVYPVFLALTDEGTSVALCGLYRDYDDTDSPKRHQYPWLAKISVTVGFSIS